MDGACGGRTDCGVTKDAHSLPAHEHSLPAHPPFRNPSQACHAPHMTVPGQDVFNLMPAQSILPPYAKGGRRLSGAGRLRVDLPISPLQAT